MATPANAPESTVQQEQAPGHQNDQAASAPMQAESTSRAEPAKQLVIPSTNPDPADEAVAVVVLSAMKGFYRKTIENHDAAKDTPAVQSDGFGPVSVERVIVVHALMHLVNKCMPTSVHFSGDDLDLAGRTVKAVLKGYPNEDKLEEWLVHTQLGYGAPRAETVWDGLLILFAHLVRKREDVLFALHTHGLEVFLSMLMPSQGTTICNIFETGCKDTPGRHQITSFIYTLGASVNTIIAIRKRGMPADPDLSESGLAAKAAVDKMVKEDDVLASAFNTLVLEKIKASDELKEPSGRRRRTRGGPRESMDDD